MSPKSLGDVRPDRLSAKFGRQKPLNNLGPGAWTTQEPGIGKKPQAC